MPKEKSFYDIYKKTRKDWGDIKPITKVIENKKHYKRRNKYPKQNLEKE